MSDALERVKIFLKLPLWDSKTHRSWSTEKRFRKKSERKGVGIQGKGGVLGATKAQAYGCKVHFPRNDRMGRRMGWPKK